jgi:endonuclease YncB( thermonuclease family)
MKLKKILNSIPLLIGVLLISSWGYKSFFRGNNQSSEAAQPNQQIWKVKSVHDGDTIRVVQGDRELKLRLCGIDAPETKQELGIKSRDYLRSLLAKNKDGMVNITEIEKDRYGRTVAEVFVYMNDNEHLDVNTEMVSAGMAWHYKKYSKNCPSHEQLGWAEANAKKDKLGVFAGNFEPPWEWRKSHK